MASNELLEIWSQSDKQSRKMAVRMAMALLPESWNTCLSMLRDATVETVGELVGPLRTKLPFLKSGYGENTGDSNKPYIVFSEWHRSYEALMKGLTTAHDEVLVKACYRYFDGIRPDLRRQFPDYDFSDCLRPDEAQRQHGRQLMVFVTGMCNLKCSYCFSNDMERRYISADQLRDIFDWAEQNGCTMVTPCGGEPLVYPHIGLFLDLVAAHGMSTYFASNCTVPLSHFTEQQLDSIDLMTFHMTESLWERSDYMRTFCENIETAQRHGIEIIARGNIISPDMDIKPWMDIVDRYGIKRMNIALTIPSGSHDNRYVDTALFSDFVPVIKQCIALCSERGINLSFAKPIPPCVFDDETAAWLLQYDNFAPLCNVHEDHGTRNICLSPAMVFTPCLGVPRPQVPFSAELTWEDLYHTLGTEVENALQKPLFEKCQRCFLYDRKLCQGACLSYKYLTAE